MYLISNENIENGSKIDKKEYKNNLFLSLNVSNLYHEKLIGGYSSRCSVSPTGDVVSELLDDYEVVLSLYDYIYEVEERDGELFVINSFDGGEYILTVLELISSLKEGKPYLKDNVPYKIAEALKKKTIEEDKLLPILRLIKNIIESMDGYKYSFMYLFKTIDEIVPDTYVKKDYFMNFLCKYLAENIESVGLINEEEKSFLKNCFQKYCIEEYKNLNLEELAMEEMPF